MSGSFVSIKFTRFQSNMFKPQSIWIALILACFTCFIRCQGHQKLFTETTTFDDGRSTLPHEWQVILLNSKVLGPFPHGSREIGTDPLSSYGGFENLVCCDGRYPSELADGGSVGWQVLKVEIDNQIQRRRKCRPYFVPKRQMGKQPSPFRLDNPKPLHIL
jgi:hypothetical protein